MVMIVAHHFAIHGGFDFPRHSITLNRLWHQFIFMGGSLGNDIFVMLSGYFLITSKGLKLHRLFNLWVRIFFYSVIIYAIFVLSGKTIFTAEALLGVMTPVISYKWWFASIYFFLYITHPYMNILLKSFTRSEYMKFLAAAFICWFIVRLLTHSGFFMSSVIYFICLYSLAGYIRLWCRDLAGKKYILYALAFVGVNFLSVIVFMLIGLRFPYFGINSGYFRGLMRPFTILAVSCLLVGFRSMNIPYSRIINLLASAAFGVYLIHDNQLMRPFLWRDVFCNALFQDSPYLIPYSIAVIVIVYASCTFLELLRSKIFRILSGGRLS